MRMSTMQKLAIAGIAAFAFLGGIGIADAQAHGGSSGFHRGSEFHGGGFHGSGGFRGGRFRGHSHGSVFIGAPIIFGPGYVPYDYSYSYGDVPFTFYGDPGAAGAEPQDSGSYYWYCRNPTGYYPDVQTCPSGWLQVVPNT
jgi:hypothetical protein